jgi:hypothetical protein
MQDDGAFAIAQALKANEDVTVTSLNFANNFLTNFGKVKLFPFYSFPPCIFFFFFFLYLLLIHIFCICILINYLIMQSALTDAKDHVYEMSEKEVNVFF